MTHMSHVKFNSFNATMLKDFVWRRRKTAFIDQRAVAAGIAAGKKGNLRVFYIKNSPWPL